MVLPTQGHLLRIFVNEVDKHESLFTAVANEHGATSG